MRYILITFIIGSILFNAWKIYLDSHKSNIDEHTIVVKEDNTSKVYKLVKEPE